MMIKVTEKCDRCGKQSEYEATLEEVIVIENDRKERKSLDEGLEEWAHSGILAHAADGPDLVVFQKKDGKYQHRSLYSLCSRTEGKRRGCGARVNDLLLDLFNEREVKPKPKAPKAPKAPKTETE